MTPEPQSIDAFLASIEHEYDIQIIGAWNNGSQAWNLANADSDWDIALLYTQPLTSYATNAFYTESIDADGTDLETLTDRANIPPGDIEFIGWDIRRFLELCGENNPSALEALNTPEAYRSHPIIEQLRAYMNDHFNIIEAWNHYQGLAKNNYNRWILEDRERTIKKNLHIIRACLIGEYIRQTHEYPTMDFPKFMDECPEDILDGWPEDEIRMLIREKKDGNGDREIGNPLGDQIEAFIDREIQHREHIRDAHAFTEAEADRHGDYQHANLPPEEMPPEGYTCWPPHCDGHIDGHQLDHYMRRLLKSRTLFQ